MVPTFKCFGNFPNFKKALQSSLTNQSFIFKMIKSQNFDNILYYFVLIYVESWEFSTPFSVEEYVCILRFQNCFFLNDIYLELRFPF